jgi:uroporphyrinogen decarboxylase
MPDSPFTEKINPDWESFVDCIARKGQPARVHNIELFLDPEVKDLVCDRYQITRDLRQGDPYFTLRREIALQRFLGYDYVLCGLTGIDMPINWLATEDTAQNKRSVGRIFVDEHTGPITTWEEFEAYPWPDTESAGTTALEWYEENLPDDMCVLGGLTGHFAENLSWLMGYETLCYSLYDQPDLVQAITDRCFEIDVSVTRQLMEFERVKMVWGSDDMGFRTGTLISPEDLRSLVLPGHKALAQITHDAGRLYLLHSCGNLAEIMDDLIDDVQIDAKHSFEDTIVDIREAKGLWGDRVALLGGIDMDFMCRADESAIRQRVFDTLNECMPGGGYCLGTGNTVANYIPLDNYIAMLDEGRKFRYSQA